MRLNESHIRELQSRVRHAVQRPEAMAGGTSLRVRAANLDKSRDFGAGARGGGGGKAPALTVHAFRNNRAC